MLNKKILLFVIVTSMFLIIACGSNNENDYTSNRYVSPPNLDNIVLETATPEIETGALITRVATCIGTSGFNDDYTMYNVLKAGDDNVIVSRTMILIVDVPERYQDNYSTFIDRYESVGLANNRTCLVNDNIMTCTEYPSMSALEFIGYSQNINDSVVRLESSGSHCSIDFSVRETVPIIETTYEITNCTIYYHGNSVSFLIKSENGRITASKTFGVLDIRTTDFTPEEIEVELQDASQHHNRGCVLDGHLITCTEAFLGSPGFFDINRINDLVEHLESTYDDVVCSIIN